MGMIPIMQKSIHCSFEPGILHICINRPGKRIALTVPMFLAAAECLKEPDQRKEVRCVLNTGVGAVFCAGHDLAAFDDWPQQVDDSTPTFLHAIADVRKPVVIAVRGSATGGAVDWPLHADWVVTSGKATFSLPFIDLAIVPKSASTLLLKKAVGLPGANRLLLSEESFTGASAHDWGLVAELAPPEKVIAAAWNRVRMLDRQGCCNHPMHQGLATSCGRLHRAHRRRSRRHSSAIGRRLETTEN